MALLFAVLVLAGFGFWWLATWPVAYAERIAKGLFFFAALVWFFTKVTI
jgi:hypothetical protein